MTTYDDDQKGDKTAVTTTDPDSSADLLAHASESTVIRPSSRIGTPQSPANASEVDTETRPAVDDNDNVPTEELDAVAEERTNESTASDGAGESKQSDAVIWMLAGLHGLQFGGAGQKYE
ncbi:hypothetical protein LTR78_007340 [Recurvomyces mirabilis]|uniref:Uncharacterized protein n=1 Tax=Recurvomyces mirabilis TaxID=574656 RepID=A0AAE0WG62_9PEZI|nr:hypothetical protein LTR78_007340 [Recurvomyces mirabilis]